MRTWLLTLMLLAVMSGAFAAAPSLYVAPNGNDRWSGTLPAPNAKKTDGPLATLGRARDLAREAAAKAPGPRTIVLRGGKYCLPATLAFTPDDRNLSFVAYPKETPEVIGGRLLTGFKSAGEGRYTLQLPEVQAGKWNFRSLFVDGQRMIRARYPNFDPSDPYRKGFLYAAKDASAFGVTVGCIHNVGDWMEYDVTIPADGEYTFWVFYGALNAPHGNTTMDGRTVIKVDGGPGTPLVDLPDTGSWSVSRWGKSATLKLTAGKHVLRWENVKGGGLNLEAYALSDDPQWKPADVKLPKPAEGKHMLVIQAEAFVKCNGPQLAVGGSGRGEIDRFYYRPGELKPEWAQAPDALIHIFQSGSCRAYLELCSIKSIDPVERVVTLTGKECTAPLMPGDRYFVENVESALDAPGEWYLNRETGVLTLIAPPGFSAKSEVLAPTMERIVESVREGETPTEGLRFEGLTFRGGDWDFDDGCTGYGMGHNGVIFLKNPRNCAVVNCRFRNLGKDAVCLSGGNNNLIERCDITDSAEGGVNLDDSARNTVSENHIHHCGRVYKHNGGVTLQGLKSAGNVVSRNVVHGMTRYGITMKGAGRENVIIGNRVLNTNLETFDTGAIEVTQGDKNGRSGTKIWNNLVGDTIGYSCTESKPVFLGWGIYLDSYAGGYDVTNNIVFRTSYGGIMYQGGKDNHVYNNIFVDGKDWQGSISNFQNNQTGCTLERNIFYFTDPKSRVFSGGPWKPETIRSDRNVFFCPTATEYLTMWNAKPFSEWQKGGQDANSVMADPLFVNAPADDYTLKPGSPAFRLGFTAIDTTKLAPPCGCRIEKLGPVYFQNLPWPGSKAVGLRPPNSTPTPASVH